MILTVRSLLPLDDRRKFELKLSWLVCWCTFGRGSFGLSIPGDVTGLGGGSVLRGAWIAPKKISNRH